MESSCVLVSRLRRRKSMRDESKITIPPTMMTRYTFMIGRPVVSDLSKID